VTFVAGQFDRQVMAMIVGEMKRDLLFTDEQIGLLMGFAFSITYAVSAIFVAYIGDRTNRKKVLSIGVAIWSVLTIACGFAKSFPSLLFARLAVGVGESVLSPTALPLVGSAFPPDRRAFPVAFCVAGSAVGLIVTPLIIGAILQATAGRTYGPFPILGILHGWQFAFVAGGLIGLLALLLLCFVKEPPREISTADAIGMRDAFGHFFRHPKLYLFLFFAVPVFATSNYGLIAWMPSYLARTFHLGFREIGFLSGIAFVPAALVSPLVAGALGRLAAKSTDTNTHIKILVWLFPIGGCFIAMPMIMPNATLSVAAFSGAVACTNVAITYGLIDIQQIVPSAYRGQATAVFMAALILIGSGIGPVLVGTLATRVVGEQFLGHAILLSLVVLFPVAMIIVSLAALKASSISRAIAE
jgi:MFS family permease